MVMFYKAHSQIFKNTQDGASRIIRKFMHFYYYYLLFLRHISIMIIAVS